MEIYNVLLESDYENEDVHSNIVSFRNKEDAIKCLNKAINDELKEAGYTSEEQEKLVKCDGDDYTCIYYRDGSKWMFRVTIYETELN